MGNLTMMWKPAALLVASLALWVAAEISNVLVDDNESEQSASVSLAVRIIFPSSIVFSLLSICLIRRNNRQHQSNDDAVESSKEQQSSTTTTRSNNQDLYWIFIPSLSLFFILILRLTIDIDHFQAYPPNLDFGPKYGIVDSETGLPVETNIAFDPEFNSFAHCIQGVLAVVLAYVSAMLAVPSGKQQQPSSCRSCSYHLASLAASAFTLYPVYNFVKRLTYRNPETFATSSFSNNAMEWAMGFWGGIGLGQCLYAYWMMRRGVSSDNNNSATESNLLSDSHASNDDGDEQSQPRQGIMSRIVTILKALLGVLLFLSVFGAAILYGYTWSNCEEIQDDNEECIFDSSQGPNIPVMVGFAAIPVVLNVVSCCCLRRQAKKNE